LAWCPSIQTSQTVYPKNQTNGPTPQHTTCKTPDLITKLKDTPILPQFTLASLDITYLYTNIPVTETRKITAKALENNIPNPQTRDELIKWYDTITKQNYLSNNGKIMIQKEGLAMGAPTSGLIAEFFLQNLENIHLAHLTEKYKIAGYF